VKKLAIDKRLGKYDPDTGTFVEHDIEKLFDPRTTQLNWFTLNAILPLKNEAQILAMLNDEVNFYKRPTFVVRIHQRYSTLRAQRERQELLEKVKS
jgi:hypothetical protein